MAKNTPKTKTFGSKAPANSDGKSKTKKQKCIDILKRPRGASLADLEKATGWQLHSVRGFLSGTVKKLADVTLVAEKDKSGTRRYRIETDKGAQS